MKNLEQEDISVEVDVVYNRCILTTEDFASMLKELFKTDKQVDKTIKIQCGPYLIKGTDYTKIIETYSEIIKETLC